jgi:hypothetical protein
MAYQREKPPPSASITVAEGTCVVGEHGGYRVIKAGSASFGHVSSRGFGVTADLCVRFVGRRVQRGALFLFLEDIVISGAFPR